MVKETELGIWIIHQARVSFNFWLANDFEKVLLPAPMFDRNQAGLILEMYENIVDKDDQSTQ